MDFACSKCGVVKPEDGFHLNARRENGRDNLCKDCRNDATKRYRSKSAETRQEVVEELKIEAESLPVAELERMEHDKDAELPLGVDCVIDKKPVMKKGWTPEAEERVRKGEVVLPGRIGPGYFWTYADPFADRNAFDDMKQRLQAVVDRIGQK